MFKASRGIEDIYELTYIRKDGSRFPAVVSVTALRDDQGAIIGYLLIGTDNTARKQAEEALLKAGALQNAIFNSANFSSIATDAKGVIQIFNVGAERMLGYAAVDVTNKITPADISDPQEVIGRAIALSLELGTPITPGFEALVFKASRGIEDIYELTYIRKDGSRFPAVVSVTALRDDQGAIIGYLLIGTDNTARKRTEEKLRGAEEMFRQLAINMPEALWIGDAESGKILYVNPIWEKVTGLRMVAGDSIDRVTAAIHPDDAQRIRHEASKFARGGIDQDCRVMRPNGVVRWVHVRTFPVEDSEGKIYQIAGIMEDITDRKVAEERLLELAHFDPLTGLPNRRHYCESLERALVVAKAQSLFVSVLFIDLDRFKNVNDTLGHALGDELLRKVSDRMIKCLRGTDILGRLGGDEFALILMNSSDPHAAAIVANTIINELHRPFDLDGHDVTVTASIGITVFPADSSDAVTLMKYADTAMYEAKSAGRDTYRFYTAEMNSRAQEKHDLENALRKAIAHNEFVLHYQPTMQINTGQWTGVEALIRWNRPGHGLVLPGDFIPALEETGLIVPVGTWVIDAACKQMAEWERAGLGPVAVAVNVSGRQFVLADKVQEDMPATRDGDNSITLLDFARAAEKALSEHHIATNLLEFELTESTLMSEAEKTVGILRKLKSLGIRISIDDFGTGYSSLAYLRRFPIDTLKIDRAFIRDITSDPEDAAITMAIISMAHSLKLEVIAEGVETKEQLDFLRTQGCDQAQGFLLARPMPADQLASLFRASKHACRSKEALIALH